MNSTSTKGPGPHVDVVGQIGELLLEELQGGRVKGALTSGESAELHLRVEGNNIEERHLPSDFRPPSRMHHLGGPEISPLEFPQS